MDGFPRRVLDTFENLKAESKETLLLRRLGKHYYVYKTTSRWDKENKKVDTKQEYLGRITEGGAFIKRFESWVGRDLKRAVALVEARGGQVVFTDKEQAGASKMPELSDAEKKVLMILSMNARAPVSVIAKKTGLTHSTAVTIVRNLEKRYGMKYFLEVDIRKLGFRPYLILAKFEGNQPPSELIQKLVQNEPRIQFAAEVKGDYDLVMYWLDDIESLEIAENLWGFESNKELKQYNIKLDVTPFGHVYSFVPLREEFLDNVLKGKMRHEGEMSLKQNVLRDREFGLIKELNNNSIANFTDIDEKYKFGRGAARYSYLDLRERGVIVRPTISLTNLPVKYIGMIVMETVNGAELEENRYRLDEDAIQYENLINRYILIGNIGISSGSIRFMPVYRENDLDDVLVPLKENVKGVRFRSMIIQRTLLGRLCYRRFDNAYSLYYSMLLSQKKIKPAVLESYEKM